SANLTEVSLGLTKKEAQKFLLIIETYAEQGFKAANNAKVAIYGASPAATTLGYGSRPHILCWSG
ncbi:MAG: hypothetical protein SGPRY_009779, partial [Prymnesium sp.]